MSLTWVNSHRSGGISPPNLTLRRRLTCTIFLPCVGSCPSWGKHTHYPLISLFKLRQGGRDRLPPFSGVRRGANAGPNWIMAASAGTSRQTRSPISGSAAHCLHQQETAGGPQTQRRTWSARYSEYQPAPARCAIGPFRLCASSCRLARCMRQSGKMLSIRPFAQGRDCCRPMVEAGTVCGRPPLEQDPVMVGMSR